MKAIRIGYQEVERMLSGGSRLALADVYYSYRDIPADVFGTAGFINKPGDVRKALSTEKKAHISASRYPRYFVKRLTSSRVCLSQKGKKCQ